MNNVASQNILRALWKQTGAVIALTLLFSSVATSGGTVRKWVIRGVPTTGPNDVCGVPQWKLPAPLPPEAHFTFVGQYNPDSAATDAIKLTSANCQKDTVLATTTDPGFLAFWGFPDPDGKLRNVPLRDVRVIAGFDGVRTMLAPPGVFPANPLPPTKSNPNKPISLGDWFKVRSTLTLRCFADGKAAVKAQFQHLLPNGVYTMFGIWKTTLPGAGSPTFLPIAFGGVPNVLVASPKGNASFTRDLDFCPKDPTPDGSVLMFVDLAYQADGHTYGAFPFTPQGTARFRTTAGENFESTLPPGVMTVVQVGFPITVEPLQ